MLIPKWKQTLFGNGDSPYGNIQLSLPISVRGLPIWKWGAYFWRPPSHALKRIFPQILDRKSRFSRSLMIVILSKSCAFPIFPPSRAFPLFAPSHSSLSLHHSHLGIVLIPAHQCFHLGIISLPAPYCRDCDITSPGAGHS